MFEFLPVKLALTNARRSSSGLFEGREPLQTDEGSQRAGRNAGADQQKIPGQHVGVEGFGQVLLKRGRNV